MQLSWGYIEIDRECSPLLRLKRAAKPHNQKTNEVVWGLSILQPAHKESLHSARAGFVCLFDHGLDESSSPPVFHHVFPIVWVPFVLVFYAKEKARETHQQIMVEEGGGGSRRIEAEVFDNERSNAHHC